jgi:hypothetical protein
MVSILLPNNIEPSATQTFSIPALMLATIQMSKMRAPLLGLSLGIVKGLMLQIRMLSGKTREQGNLCPSPRVRIRRRLYHGLYIDSI